MDEENVPMRMTLASQVAELKRDHAELQESHDKLSKEFGMAIERIEKLELETGIIKHDNPRTPYYR